MRRRLLIVLIAAAACALILALVALLVLHSEAVETRIREKLVQELERISGGEASVAQVEPTLVPIGLRARGVEVRGGRRVVRELSVGQGGVSIHGWDLLLGRVRLASIELEGVSLSVGPPLDAPDRGRETRVDLAPISRLRRIRVLDGRLAVDSEEIPFELDARNVRIDVGAEEGRQELGAGTFESGPVDLSFGPLAPRSFDRVAADITWRPPRIVIDRVEIEGPSDSIAAELYVGITQEGAVARGTARASTLAETLLAEPPVEISGPLRATARFNAAVPGDWKVVGEVAGEGPFTIDDLELSALSGSYELTPGRVVVSGIEARTPDGSRVDDATFDRQAGAWTLSASGTADVEEVAARLGLEREAVSGRAAVTLGADGEGSSVNRWEATAEISSLALSAGALSGTAFARADEASGRLRFDGSWSGSAALVEATWSGPLPNGHWSAEARLSARSSESAIFAVDTLAEQLAERGARLPDGLVPEALAGLTAAASLDGDAMRLASLSVTAELEQPRFRFGSYDRLELRAERSGAGLWDASGRLADEAGLGVRARVEGSVSGWLEYSMEGDDVSWEAIRAVVPQAPPELPG